MKILELPVETTIHCKCGCKFEFDTDDVEIDTIYADCIMLKHILIECPFCEQKMIIHKVKD